MVSIGRLAREFKLSRSTLLYYDRIGLLKPSARSRANYREYSQADRKRLEQICRYRRAGVSLADIGRILNAGSRGAVADILERRLIELDRQMRDLRAQQQVLLNLLNSGKLPKRKKGLTKVQWTELLRASGLDDAGMHRWHEAFERRFPADHRSFLASLGIAKPEIDQIRQRSRTAFTPQQGVEKRHERSSGKAK